MYLIDDKISFEDNARLNGYYVDIPHLVIFVSLNVTMNKISVFMDKNNIIFTKILLTYILLKAKHKLRNKKSLCPFEYHITYKHFS